MEKNIQINVKTDTGEYDQLFPQTKAEIVNFKNSNTHFNSTNVNDGLNELANIKEIKLLASGWSSSSPYTQTINVSGMTEYNAPIISHGSYIQLSGTSVKNENKAYNCIDVVKTGNGNITFYCYNKKPVSDFNVYMKGV